LQAQAYNASNCRVLRGCRELSGKTTLPKYSLPEQPRATYAIKRACQPRSRRRGVGRLVWDGPGVFFRAGRPVVQKDRISDPFPAHTLLVFRRRLHTFAGKSHLRANKPTVDRWAGGERGGDILLALTPGLDANDVAGWSRTLHPLLAIGARRLLTRRKKVVKNLDLSEVFALRRHKLPEETILCEINPG
jgi:hypothetical protein